MKNINLVSFDILGGEVSLPKHLRLMDIASIQRTNSQLLQQLMPPEQIQKLIKIGNYYVIPPTSPSLKEYVDKFTQAVRKIRKTNVVELQKSILEIQHFIDQLTDIEEIDTEEISQNLSEISDDLAENKPLSFEQIKKLILLLFAFLCWFIPAYPAIEKIYKDLTYNPISEICGVLSQLEKEAVKFVEVDHRGGISLYQYPKGKKSVDFVLNGTQLCMLTEPKGNAKRVKVVLQLENYKQITGYADRNKLKRLYKNE